MKNLEIGQKTKDGDVNLSKCSLAQLNDILNRQSRLLSNRKFVSQLPDKGDKIIKFNDKIIAEMQLRDEVKGACDMISNLSLSDIPTNLEWKNQLAASNVRNGDGSDDDSNPLKILANHSGTLKAYQERIEPQTPSLVTKQDVREAHLISSTSATSYAQKLCKKYDQKVAVERFKPCLPKQKELAKSGLKSSCENVQKYLGKNWEVTAATPPVPVYANVESISLADSLVLQQEQATKLKEIQLKEAMSRLRDSSTISFGCSLPTSNLMAYRIPADPARLFEGTPTRDQHVEVSDDIDDPESGGAVFYNIIDDIPEKT